MKRITASVRLLWLSAACWLTLAGGLPDVHARSTFAIGDSDFLLDGKAFQIKAGEMHPARIPHEYWADRLRMMHAMGLNTVSIYVFWNQHEPREGQFDFSGDADVAQFVRLAQKEGLWVIVRPSPYVCAEWEFGGYPWWLLKQHDLKVRSQDPRFLAAAESYLKKLGEQLAPLQITHGGPIIMVQVENEYGSYGGDHVYMGKIRDMERAAGFDVPFFTADGGGNMMANGHLDDVLPGLNGGGQDIMKEVGKYRPTGPWFVPEFYPGWLDHWGEAHAHTGIGGLVRETEWKLTHHVSFCYYMIYGGTSFGFTSGANYGGHFQPQPTSYDYDAPIDEMGRPTPKFFALRDVLAKHLGPGETLPEVPATTPVIEIPRIELTESASIFDNLGAPVKSEKPLSFEDLDQGNGYVLYRTTIAGPVDATLKIKELRDFAVVCVDGKRIAALDRRHNQNSTALKIDAPSATLDILVENGGRINYGGRLTDNRKGITESVTLGDRELTAWEMYKLPFDDVSTLNFKSTPTCAAPALHRGTFDLTKIGDAFLDMRDWGKGIVFVNGHNLGRYWYIGPQQTLYVPGVWLKQGRNEIVVFEQLRDDVHSIAGIKSPILDQLDKDENAASRGPMKKPSLQSASLVKEGSLADDRDAQDIVFPTKTARYLCLQALSSQNGDEYTTLAELDALDAAGHTLSHQAWKILYVDSEENLAEGDQAENAIDGDPDSFWHTLWSAPHTSHPHTLVIDLGAEHQLSGVRLLPRQDSPHGRIKDYRLYLSIAPL
ncbi:MAG TPA: beta-galactosidase [Verrucomicrobiae bacterium]|jgi:beta-galactosidase|nr:beta-galactosidase [Verrucomicrobiae bacterium]